MSQCRALTQKDVSSPCTFGTDLGQCQHGTKLNSNASCAVICPAGQTGGGKISCNSGSIDFTSCTCNTESTCGAASCYRCNGETGKCKDDKKGPYTTQKACNSACPKLEQICKSPYGGPNTNCTEVKKTAASGNPQTTCKNFSPTEQQVINSLVATGCSKKQASAQWTNVKNCLCYGTGPSPIPGPPSSSKSLSVPVIIIISVASVVAVSVVIYLLTRKK